MLEKIKNLSKENRKRALILGSLLGVFLIFGFEGLLLFVGGGIFYHVLSNRYGLKI